MKNKYAKFLRGLANKGSSTGFGVCILFETELEDSLHNILPYSVYESWEHFSGWEHYPVPSPSSDIGPEEAFNNLPKWKGTYGLMRRAWCEHLANYFERCAILHGVRNNLQSTGHTFSEKHELRCILLTSRKNGRCCEKRITATFLDMSANPVEIITDCLTLAD